MTLGSTAETAIGAIKGTISEKDLKNMLKDSYTDGASISDITVSGSKITVFVYKVGGYTVTITTTGDSKGTTVVKDAD